MPSRVPISMKYRSFSILFSAALLSYQRKKKNVTIATIRGKTPITTLPAIACTGYSSSIDGSILSGRWDSYNNMYNNYYDELKVLYINCKVESVASYLPTTIGKVSEVP